MSTRAEKTKIIVTEGISIPGEDGKTPYIENGYWYIDGENTGVKATGVAPEIVNNYWHIDGVNTGIKAVGEDGADGKDGAGLFAFEVDANGHLLLHYDDNVLPQPPNFYIDENGHLIYTI